MNDLSESLKKIRDYTQENEELLKCHHFLFNGIYEREKRKDLNGKADVIVMSLNPADTEPDWEYRKETPTENSNEFDFHDYVEKISGSAKRWERKTKLFAQDLFGYKINETAFFFWSSPQIGESKDKIKFSERFGYKWKSKECYDHFHFCKERNLELIEYHEPKVILAPGISDSAFFANIYEMRHMDTLMNNGQRIIEHYELGKTPFIFTKHWTGARGFSKLQEEIIVNYLKSLL